MSIERTFDLIINAGTSSPLIINANQNDSGEIWKFNLYQEDGTKVIPAAGEIVGLKTDGHAIVNAGTVNASGQVVITETAQITAAVGANVFEIVFDSVHGTANFILYVEKSPVDDDADFSESDISAIQQAIAMAIDSATVQALQNGLAQESATRAAQDAQLAGDISEESTTRATADAVLRQAIDDAAIVPAGSTVVVDNTLSIAGAAADAKKTGDAVSDLNSALSVVENAVFDREETVLTGSFFRNVNLLASGEYTSYSTVKGYLYDVRNIDRVSVKTRLRPTGGSEKCVLAFYSVVTSDMPAPSTATVDICTGHGNVYPINTDARSVEEELNVPANSKTLLVCFDNDYIDDIETDLIVKSVLITDNIQKNAEDIADLQNSINPEPDIDAFNPVLVYDKNDNQTIGIWNYAGIIVSSTETQQGYISFDKVEVIPNGKYTLYNFAGIYQLYDSEGIHGTQSSTYNVLSTVTITIPSDKHYIGISRNRGRLSDDFRFTRDTPNQEELSNLPVYFEKLSIKPLNIISDLMCSLVAPLKGKKIVNLGDSIFGNFRDDNKSNVSISTMIANRTGADVYNCGFGGCRMAATQNNYYDDFTCEKIAESIASGDWSLQDQGIIDAESAGSPAAYIRGYWADSLAILKNIDWSVVDYVTIGYGTNDYMGEVTEAQFKNALNSAIEDIQTAYPNIKILVISPMWRWWDDSKIDSDHFQNNTGLYLYDYVEFCKTVADNNHVEYVDTYTNLGINQFNKLQYFNADDGTHPNLNGRQLRANKISGCLIECG